MPAPLPMLVPPLAPPLLRLLVELEQVPVPRWWVEMLTVASVFSVSSSMQQAAGPPFAHGVLAIPQQADLSIF